MTDAGKVRTMVARALRVWENNSKLTFREVYSDQADIQVLFARCVYRECDSEEGGEVDGGGLSHKRKIVV